MLCFEQDDGPILIAKALTIYCEVVIVVVDPESGGGGGEQSARSLFFVGQNTNLLAIISTGLAGRSLLIEKIRSAL